MVNEGNKDIRVIRTMGPANRMWAALHQASHVIEQVREHEMRRLGISMMQSAVMWVVKTTEPPVTPAKISQYLLRRPNSIAGLLDRMEKQDLIRRMKDAQTNRTIVELTEKGDSILRESVSDMQSIHNIASVLSEEEIARTTEALLALRARAIQELAAQQQAFLH